MEQRLLFELRCSSSFSARVASTSSPSRCCSFGQTSRAAATANPRGQRARPQQRSRRSLLLLAAKSSSLPSFAATSRPLSRSILIATRSFENSARPVRVLASSEESQGAGGEPSVASSSPTIPTSSPTPSSSSPSSSSSSPPGAALAAAAATLGVVLFAVTRLSTGGVTLADVAALSVPLDAALSSGKPTIIEFYADYCDVCKALAPDSAAVAKKYSGGGGSGSDGSGGGAPASAAARSLNFVLLNADNARWSPEVAEYGVRGVPHFVFLGPDGAAKGAAVGRLPPGELEADAADLVEGRPLSIGSGGGSRRLSGGGGSSAAPSPSSSSSGLGEVTLLRGGKKNPPAPRAHG